MDVFPTHQEHEQLSAQTRNALIAFMRKHSPLALEDQRDPQRRPVLPEARVRLATTLPLSSTVADVHIVLDELLHVARAVEATR